MTATRPFVLHVDDRPEELRGWESEVKSQGNFELVVCHPQDVERAHLERASLVLVDFKIEDWPERANTLALALQPPNGLAVLATLQERAIELESKPRAFALFTGVIHDVARRLVPQPHLVARAHNLDWVFEKNTLYAKPTSQVASLSAAIAQLPLDWPGEDAERATRALSAWLGLPADAPWSDIALRSVERCRPPIHEFAEHTLGVGVIRWLLHKILPYPTFLLDDTHLAARLRVAAASLLRVAESAEFGDLFGSSRYRGALETFLGRRWWRAGIEFAIFEATADRPGDLRELRDVLRKRIPGIECIEVPRLFPVLDANFVTKPELATEDQVVEVRPDDWPPYADDAWALRIDVEDHDGLRAIAIETD